MNVLNEKLVTRWNDTMVLIGCEHLTINTRLSELETHKDFYGTENGVTVEWMIKELKYWLYCYNEPGNVRYEDKFIDRECYKTWISETGKLKRLLAKLETMENDIVVEW